MAHKLLHTLVISSALALDVYGCAAAPRPLEPVAALDAVTVEASAEEARAFQFRQADSEPMTTPAPATPGSALQALRSCEEGWPTTKGTMCEPVEQPDGTTQEVCCGSGQRDCCIQEPGQ